MGWYGWWSFSILLPIYELLHCCFSFILITIFINRVEWCTRSWSSIRCMPSTTNCDTFIACSFDILPWSSTLPLLWLLLNLNLVILRILYIKNLLSWSSTLSFLLWLLLNVNFIIFRYLHIKSLLPWSTSFLFSVKLFLVGFTKPLLLRFSEHKIVKVRILLSDNVTSFMGRKIYRWLLRLLINCFFKKNTCFLRQMLWSNKWTHVF